MNLSNRTKGILFLMASAFCFACMAVFVRLSGDLPSIQKSFFRNFIAFLTACALLVKTPSAVRIQKGNFKFFFLRAAFGTIGILGNFYAVDHILLSDASMLNKLSPFFVLLFSFLFLKEKLKPFQAIAVIIAFSGSLFIIKPSFQADGNLLPYLAGLLGAFGAGSAYTLVRYLKQKGEHSAMIVFFFSGFSCLVSLPWLIFDFHPMSAYQVLMLLLAGLAAAGGQFTITAAYAQAPAREISIFDYSQIIFSAMLGFFVFGQIPDVLSIIGYIIILGVSAAIFFYNQRLSERTEKS